MINSKLKILHCITDEKFIDRCVIERFEYFNSKIENWYAIVRKNRTKPIIKYNYIKRENFVIQLTNSQFLDFLKRTGINVVILHSLCTLSCFLIYKIPPDIKVVWFAWGYDLYTTLAYRPFIEIPNLYGRITSEVIKGDSNAVKGFLQKSKRIIFDYWIKKSVSRVDYFSGIIPEEYDRMKLLPFFHAAKVVFNYEVLPSEDDNVSNCAIAKNRNILIGNSADMTNNHLDIFEILKKLNLGNRKIFVPLSYSGTEKYRELVKKKGREYWGENFIPIENFVPYKEYSQMLLSCSIRIFGHERQQAMGNIDIAWKQGCKIFLSETSMAYNYYRKLGIKFFTIQHDLTQQCLDALYPENAARNIRKQLYEKSNPYRALKDLEALINDLSV